MLIQYDFIVSFNSKKYLSILIKCSRNVHYNSQGRLEQVLLTLLKTKVRGTEGFLLINS